ncbi:MAG: hypothetical protein KGN78_05035 [Actinomycetales bacterium]|nr:hypothetical protein [Actinomycetales bacterium]
MSERNYSIVEGLGDARSLIFATWLKSYQNSSLFAKGVPRETFFAQHHKVIERILERAEVRLAVLPDDPSVVFGWSVTEPCQRISIVDRDAGIVRVTPESVVHYVYVKPDFRRYGIAKALLAHVAGEPWRYSHSTYILRDLRENKVIPDTVIYDPYEAFR